MIIQVVKKRTDNYFTVKEVNPSDGSFILRDRTLCAAFPKHAVKAVQVGSVWEVKATPTIKSFKVDGKEYTEDEIRPRKPKLLRASGELLAKWISENVDGIGDVKAQRLVRLFPNLNELARNGDVEALSKPNGMSNDTAQRIIDKWPSEAFYRVIEWLQDARLPMHTADRIARAYGDTAIERLSEDPFIMRSVGVSFKKIMEIIKTSKIKVSKEVLCAAVVEQVAHQYCTNNGSTMMPHEKLMDEANKLIDKAELKIKCSEKNLIEAAINKGIVIRVKDAYQPIGRAIQEAAVARFLNKCNDRKNGDRSIMAQWEDSLSKKTANEALKEFETTLPFKLTKEQQDAVIVSAMNKFSIISGGAGTGKTTILLAVLSVYEELSKGMAIFQLALSGRAARRMQESTGRDAMTIAKFINEYTDMATNTAASKMPDHLLLVIDEASMVDLMSMYRLVNILPEATRILLVGDVAQLPPVGAGLVFHAAMESDLNATELTQVKRQGEQSGIHKLATAIRNGNYDPTLFNSKSNDVKYSANDSHTNILQEYSSAILEGDAIILTPTRKGNLGVDAINKLVQSTYDENEPPEIKYDDPVYGLIPWVTKTNAVLRLHDKIIVTKNDYDIDIRNGDLGEIVEVYEEAESGVYGIAKIDGYRIPITADVLEILDLGYAITIHKSQGSQWHTCIQLLPSYADQMLDQTLLYTAVTRPSNNLIILGDGSLIKGAIKRGSSVHERTTNMIARLKAKPNTYNPPLSNHRQRELPV